MRVNLSALCSMVSALLALACSRPSGEPERGVRPTALVLSGSPTPSASSAALPAAQRRPLELKLRADDMPSGGQRVMAVLPELGIEELVAEAPAPFVCQKTLRPAASEPRLGGSNWLDVWCGARRVAVTQDEGFLMLGDRQIPLPPGRYVRLRAVPQLELKERTCEKTSERVSIQLVARGSELKLEVPKLGLSLSLKQFPRDGGFRCKTIVDQAALRMRVWHSTDPNSLLIAEFDLQVVSGVLIVEDTWQHYERSSYSRWGIRLPCGRVQLKGVNYQSARYGLPTCSEKCLERVYACQSKCNDEIDGCNEGCAERGGRCMRSCGE
jgi:hypothetical protein